MTCSLFVETKFVPEHVEHKTRAGRQHYESMLKHLLKPETVNRVFNPEKTAGGRLKSLADWPYLDEVRLCDITADHVRRLLTCAFDRDYSSQTVRHIKNAIFAIISHAQTEGCFSGPNPAAQVKLPPVTRKERHDLTIDQTEAMLELMQYPEKEMALIAITTDMNIAEICNLQWKHVNLTESIRNVDGELIPARSIAVTSEWDRAALADSRRGRKRNFEIPGPLLGVLANLHRQHAEANPDDFILATETGRPIWPAHARSARLKPIARKLGLPWLSWRVIGRAHAALLSEMRTQLIDRMVQIARGKATIMRRRHQLSGAGLVNDQVQLGASSGFFHSVRATSRGRGISHDECGF